MPHLDIGYAAKVMALGVFIKAILMVAVVTTVAATTFGQSLILVLVSACATGVFALLVVLIQTRSDRRLHERLDRLETSQAREIAAQTRELSTVVESGGDK